MKEEGQVKSETFVDLYAAAAEDELATETVFSSLLKGQVPGAKGFMKLG